ncbi:MAG: hypothetical protein V4673_04240 [Pseudomonadota bacterium]
MKTAFPAIAALLALTSACTRHDTAPDRPPMPGASDASPRCSIAGVDGKRLWTDVPAQADNCGMQRFVLNNFLYLAHDDSDGHPRFMSMAPWYDAIPQDGSAPRWRDGFKPLSTRALRKTSREGQPGDSFELIDSAYRRVGYDVRVNDVFVDYLATSRTYRADVLAAAEAAFQRDPSSGGVWLPSGSEKTPGVISIKTSWRSFPAGKPCPAATMHCERDARGHWWGLIGLHLVQKTPTLGEMTWATFEHVANAPDCSPGGSAPIAPAPADPRHPGKTLPEWHLFDWTSYRAQGGDGARCAVPDGAYQYTVAADGQTLQNQTCGTPSATPLCNIDPRLASVNGVQIDSDANTRFHRINVCRTVAQPRCSGSGAEGEQVACLNRALADDFPAALADKWRYYALIGSVYMAGHAPGVGCFRYDDGPMLTTQPPRSRFPSTCAGSTTAPQRARAGDLRLANTSMETWMQDGTCLVSAPGSTPLMGRDCFACHAPATNEPGWPFGMGDMCFLFDRIPVSGTTQ